MQCPLWYRRRYAWKRRQSHQRNDRWRRCRSDLYRVLYREVLPQVGRRASFLSHTIRPVRLFLAPVELKSTAGSVNPRSSVGGAPAFTISSFVAAALSACFPTVGVEPRSTTIGTMPHGVCGCKAISNVAQDALVLNSSSTLASSGTGCHSSLALIARLRLSRSTCLHALTGRWVEHMNKILRQSYSQAVYFFTLHNNGVPHTHAIDERYMYVVKFINILLITALLDHFPHLVRLWVLTVTAVILSVIMRV